MFFQWVLCLGIWMVGLVVNIVRFQPPFFLPTLMGGFLWTTGNLMAVPVIKMIGLTMGLTVWGVTNMLSGWFIGKVVLKESVDCSPLNYSAVGVVVISVIILAFVKSSGKNIERRGGLSETTPLLSEQDSLEGSLRDKVREASIQASSDKLTFSPSTVRNGGTGAQEWNENDEDFSWTDRLGVWPRRIIGFSLALLAGLFFGTQFIFIQYLKFCTDEAHTCNDTDYLFGHFSGILLASTFYLVIYSVVKRNRPCVYPRVIVPGLISGIMWGIAMVGWFLANQRLSLAVSFPVITAGPGFVSSAWGIFIFREIKGWKNITLYFVAFLVSLCGQVMDGLSKQTVQCTLH
jgi:glucose uptake protein GlcU